MTVPIALAQADFLVGDLNGNAHRIVSLAQAARDRGAAAVVFPELCLSGYPPEDLLLRPHFLEHVEHTLHHLARQIEGITAIVGFPERAQGLPANSAAVIREGRVTAIYRKQMLPNYGVFDEKRYFQPGHTPLVFDLNGIPTGLALCEDVWVSGPIEQAAQAGARLILTLNASPYHLGKMAEREQVLRQRVMSVGIPLVYVNLTGGQDELVFDGASLVMNADGQVTQRLPAFTEQLAIAHFTTGERVEPIHAGISPEASDEACLYQALVTGIRDYVHKNHFAGAVLGLSGGIDSALTLTLAVDALGADQVEVLLMPSRYTADMSIEDARLEAEALGVRHHLISIEPAYQTFTHLLADSFADLPPDTTEENLQARCRGILLMAFSNKKRKILLTTGNKSEMSVGYATLYGDMAGGFAPLKDVSKLWVYRLAAYRNRLKPAIPERVITRPPSAELKPDQTDQDSLPPYPMLDAILERYIEQDQSIQDIIQAGYPEAEVRRITRLVDQNEYKRRQAPPGVKITRRAFGRDRRYPMTCGYVSNE
ncbi:MAG: NAD+ synthase [Methylococcaceae bacterium]